MHVNVKTVAGRSLVADLFDDPTVLQLRQWLASAHSYDFASVKIIRNGTVLPDETPVGTGEGGLVVVAKKSGLWARPRSAPSQPEQPSRGEQSSSSAEPSTVTSTQEPAPTNVPEPVGPLRREEIQELVALQGLFANRALTAADVIDVLRYDRAITVMRLLVQADPSLLGPVLVQLHYHAPGLVAVIAANQERFVELINEPVALGTGSEPPLSSREGELLLDYDPDGFPEEPYDGFEACEDDPSLDVPQPPLAGARVSPPQASAESSALPAASPPLPKEYPPAAQEPEERRTPHHPSAEAAAVAMPQAEGRREESSELAEQELCPYLRAQLALLAQGKADEALLMAEQARVDLAPADAFSMAMRHLHASAAPLSSSSSPRSEELGESYSLGLPELRKAVSASGATAVYYSLGSPSGSVFVWVVPESLEASVRFRKLTVDLAHVESSLGTVVRALGRNSGLNPHNVCRRVFAELSASLVQPIADLLPAHGSAIAVITPSEGVLAHIPFAALPLDSSPSSPTSPAPAQTPEQSCLAHRHPITTAHSLHSLALGAAQLGQNQPRSGGATSLAPLCIDSEDAATAAARRPQRGVVQLKDQTLATAFLPTSSAQSSQDPVEALPSGQSLLVVPQCNSSSSSSVGGAAGAARRAPASAGRGALNEELATLTRAAVAAGFGCTVLPLWKLKGAEEEGRQRFLQLLYAELQGGSTVAEAFRGAVLRAGSEVPMGQWACLAVMGPPSWRLPPASTSVPVEEPLEPQSQSVAAEPAPLPTPSSDSPSEVPAATNPPPGGYSSVPSGPPKKPTLPTPEDYQYLKGHRIHVLYERLVRELLSNQPSDAAEFVLAYLKENQGALRDLLAGKIQLQPL